MRTARSVVLILSFIGILHAAPSERREELHRLAREEKWTELLELTQEPSASSSEILYYRGLAQARLGRREAARTTLEEGLERYPGDSRFPLELGGLAFAERDLPRARRLVVLALELDPGDPYANDLLGTVCYLQGDLESALEFWNRIDKPRISKVTLQPDSDLEPLLLNRLIPAVPGQILELEDLLDTRAVLEELHLYSVLRAELEPDRDNRFTLDLSVYRRRGLSGGKRSVLLSTLRGFPFQTLHADWFNLDGSALNFNSLFRWDARKRRLLSRLERPFTLHPQWRWSFFGDLRHEDWRLQGNGVDVNDRFPVFRLERRQLGFQLGWIPGDRWHWSGGPHVVWRNFGFVDQETTARTRRWNGWSLGYSTAVRRRLLYRPQNRLKLSAVARMTAETTLRSPRTRMIRVEGGTDLSAFLQPEALDWRIQVTYRTGTIGGTSPLDDLFFLGYDRDDPTGLRGHIATSDGYKGNAPFGTRQHLIRTEIEKQVWGNGLVRISVSPFFDVGKAWHAQDLPSSRGWLADTGAQVTLSTPLGLGVVFNWGWDLVDGGSSWYASPADPLLPGHPIR